MRSRRGITLFTFLLIFIELIGCRLWLAEEAGWPDITSVFVVLSLAASASAGFLAGRFLPGILSKASFKSEPFRDGAGGKHVFLLLWAILFACYIPCFLAFYPGIYNNDMVWQWAMYVMNYYNSHHPILHTFLTGSLFELGNRVFGSYDAGLVIHSVLQLLILSGSEAFALRYLIKTGCSKRAFMAVALFYSLYPYIPVMGLSTTKDTVFGSLFLLVFVCLCEMAQERKLFSGWRLALFFVILVLSGLFRNNAVYGYLVMVCCLLVWALVLKLRRRGGGFQGGLALILSGSIIVTEICLMLLLAAFPSEKGKINEMMSVPCQQMARTYVRHGDELTEEEKRVLFSFIPEENLENYVYYISDHVKNHLNEEALKSNFKDFIKLWIHLGLRYPGEYVTAFLNNTFGVWHLLGDTGSSLPYEYLPFFDDVHVFHEASFLPRLQKFYKWFNYRNYVRYLPVVSMIFYTPFFTWLTVWGGFVIADRKRYHLMVLPLFLLCYVFTIMLGPCVAVRYMFNVILCSPVLAAVAFIPKNRIS